jgi:hypothetical protein
MSVDYRDRNKPITAEDLIRRYNFENITKAMKATQSNKEGLDKTNTIMNEFIESTTENLQELQNQVDGNITTWFFSGVPTLENQPANDWETDDDKLNHLGDLYYDKETGYAYRFSSDEDIYYWFKLTDSDVTEALAIANAAKDTADSKRRIFVNQPTIPYDIGDLWIRGDQELYRCARSRDSDEFDASDFVLATKYTDDTVATEALAVANQTKNNLTANYVTNTTLETTKDSINGNIQGLTILVNEKNKIYTSQPSPPYNIGDIYVLNNKVYVCQNAKDETEKYSEDDWILDIDTANLVSETTFNATTGKIEASVRELSGNTQTNTNKIASLELNVNKIETEIGDIADITTSDTSEIADITLNNVNESEPININIHPILEDIAYLYPYSDLYPSADLYPKSRIIRFKNTNLNESIDYEIPYDLLYYDSEIYDEFILDYENQLCQIVKRVGYNSKGEKYVLEDATILSFEYPKITLNNGNYNVYLLGYTSGYIFVRLMASNMYTSQFATRVELNSAITQSAEEIELQVSKKVGDDEIISKINQSAERIGIDADKISLKGKEIDLTSDDITINSTNFQVDKNGNLKANNGTFTNGVFSGEINASSGVFNGTVNAASGTFNGTVNASSGTFTGTVNANGGRIGNFTLDSGAIYSGNDNARAGMGVYGTNYAFWAGSSDSNSAPFRVGHDGAFKATNADISGNINATSGTFNGTVNASSGTFNGTVNASSGSFTGAVNATSGTFKGSIYSSSGTIGGWHLSSSKLYGTSDQIQYSIRPYGVSNDTAGISQSWGRIISAASDRRLKNNIKSIEEKFDDFFDDLKPVTFNYNKGIDDGRKHIGFIAQDVLLSEKIIDEDLSITEKTEEKGYYNLYKEEIIALNTWQIQNLKKQFKEQQEEIESLKEEIKALKESGNNGTNTDI